MKKLKNLNKFYYVLLGILIVLAIVVVFIFRSIFSAFSLSKEVDQEFLDQNTPRLNHEKLNEAYKIIYEPEKHELDL